MPYNHCEMDKLATMSYTSAMISWPNHNQAPRNMYQISMCKQALGCNMRWGATKELQTPHDPIVVTSMHKILDLEGMGPGNMLTLAMYSLPNNSEDAFVFKEYTDRGVLLMLGRMTLLMMQSPCSRYSLILGSLLLSIVVYLLLLLGLASISVLSAVLLMTVFRLIILSPVYMRFGDCGVVHSVKCSSINQTERLRGAEDSQETDRGRQVG